MGASSLLGEQVAHDGGILRSEHPNNVTWCPLEDQGHVKTYVKTGGAKIDVVRENSGYGLTFNWPILSGVDKGEVDGGLVKSGYSKR